MAEKITLRAKSDGTEISGELIVDNADSWILKFAPETRSNAFLKSEWERVYTIPTAPGTVFRATVRGKGNVRLMVADTEPQDLIYLSPRTVIEGWRWHSAESIDASSVVIELEGEE